MYLKFHHFVKNYLYLHYHFHYYQYWYNQYMLLKMDYNYLAVFDLIQYNLFNGAVFLFILNFKFINQFNSTQ